MFAQFFLQIAPNASGADLAHLLGKSKPYVAQLRTGKRIPTDEDVILLAQSYAPNQMEEWMLCAYLDRLQGKEFKDCELKKSGIASIRKLMRHCKPQQHIAGSRTLREFPDAFSPLAIIMGDKRETRGRHIGAGDFGVHTTTTADSRWLMSLGLSNDVVHYIDKDFVLMEEGSLIKRFAEKNLLVIGSPAVNHLSRRINRSSIFRFNINSDVDEGLEEIIATAKAKSKSKDELALFYQESKEDLIKLMRYLFVGGIVDPTYPKGDYVTSTYHKMPGNIDTDFGVLSFAANPFYEAKCQAEGRPNDHKYISIFAAGIHHPATAHAIRQLGTYGKETGTFDQHPYGGVFRVELDLQQHFFSDRVQDGGFQWEDDADDQRMPIEDQGKCLISELEYIENERRLENLNTLQLKPEHALEARGLIHALQLNGGAM
ncbi:helix-turn-helix transcriptional regulator [Verrucomicrobia bacterium]|nr:helix-turn-helix transcriptional regulator [Verrucomicrobiota bacterium]